MAVWEQTGDWDGLRNKQGAKLFPAQCSGCGDNRLRTKYQLSKKQGCQRCKCGRKISGNPATTAAWNNFLSNAKRRDIEVSVTREHWYGLVTLPCKYCGDSCGNCARTKYHEFLHTGVDRVDSSGPYSTDNVVPCCAWCNTSKMNHSLEHFQKKIAQAYNHMQLS